MGQITFTSDIHTPSVYLSKRANGTYSIVSQGMPVNNFTTKEICINLAAKYKLTLSSLVWDCVNGIFINE